MNMQDDDTTSRLRPIIAKVLKLPVGDIGSGTSRGTTAQWDSLSHMNLMLALEEEFGVEFSDGEIADIASYAALAEALRRKQA